MTLNMQDIANALTGMQIIDCALSAKALCLVATPRSEDELRRDRKRVLEIGLDGGSLVYHDLSGHLLLYVEAVSTGFVLVSDDGEVATLVDGELSLHAAIPETPTGPRRGGVTKLRRFANALHVCSNLRGLCRFDAGGWHSLCPPTAYHPDLGLRQVLDWGFRDADGFDTSELYACGHRGDLWMYRSGSWTQIEFPSNRQLYTICCASDGRVYVGAESGVIFVGRGQDWRLLRQDDMTLPFRDMVDFEGRILCASDYGLWEIDGAGEFDDADVPDWVRICAGNLAVGEGRLALAGAFGVALLDSRGWTPILDYYSVEV